MVRQLSSWTTQFGDYFCFLIIREVTTGHGCELCVSSLIIVHFVEYHLLLHESKTTLQSLVTMQWATLLAAATALAGNVAAQNMLRFACSQLVVERTDPLVNPGVKYTPHLHQIVGGDSFNITMDPANDPAQLSKCTSCSFVQDKSNYWTAVMFFKAKNGKL